jgi:hypothetical protein
MPIAPLPSARKIEERALKIELWLLIIICLVCLGSLPIVPRLISVTLPTPAIRASECSAPPQKVPYLPNPQEYASTPSVAATWHQLGRDNEDFACAQAWAASFVVAYYTLDSRRVETFEASVPLLSSGGRQRFYGKSGQGPHEKADPRIDPLWRAQAQKRHLRQVVQVSPPSLLNAQYQNGFLLAWMVVPYQLSLSSNGKTTTNIYHDTVLLIQKTAATPNQRLSWQVSDWRESISLFTPPHIL